MAKYIWTAPKGAGRKLARLTGIDRIRFTKIEEYDYQPDDIIFNWGNGTLPTGIPEDAFFNKPTSIKNSVRKLRTFKLLREAGVPIVEYTSKRGTAVEWLAAGCTVYARTLNAGHAGAGIVICSPGDVPPECNLYTKRFNAKREYRLHCSVTGQLLLSQKRRRKDGSTGDRMIKNLKNGYVFCFDKVDPVDYNLSVLAANTLTALDLDFCAIDFLYSSTTGALKILEVNTRPGHSAPTVANYYANMMLEV